jgi:hypothetical protein
MTEITNVMVEESGLPGCDGVNESMVLDISNECRAFIFKCQAVQEEPLTK